MPCTPRETALTLLAERGAAKLEHLRAVIMERFPSLSFLAATDLLEEAMRTRDKCLAAGARVARGEADRDEALDDLAARWPEAGWPLVSTS